MKLNLFAHKEKKVTLMADGPGKPDVELQCPLCGRRFLPAEAAGCAGCPSLLRCKLIMCPNCYHEFPKV